MDRKAFKGLQKQPVQKEIQGQLAQQEHRAFRGLREQRGQKEIQGQLVQQEHKAFRGSREQLVRQEHKVFRGLREQQVQKKEIRGQLVQRERIIERHTIDGRPQAPQIVTIDRPQDLRQIYPDTMRAAIERGTPAQIEAPDAYPVELPTADVWAQLETLFKD